MSHFKDQRIALLTQHGKERVIAPVLEPALSCVIETVTGFDTDQLGSFTRDVPRWGSQLDAARRKARIGMELSGLPIGLASEGSFTMDPWSGLFAWNLEALILIDDRLGIEVIGRAQGPGAAGQLLTADWSELEDFAKAEDFPAHQLVLRPQAPEDERFIKGISDWVQLKAAFAHCVAQATNLKVFAETDVRAFANPTRMELIGEAAKDLLNRLQTDCTACGMPGYGIIEQRRGLPCKRCGRPTDVPIADLMQCVACAHQEEVVRPGKTSADPQHCSHCNP